MSITAETAKAHAHDPAVLCCRAEAGITIEPANLEDPAIFDDLVDSGLLNLDGCLTIEEVLGAKLTKTCDSLCPLTNDVLDGVKVPTTPVEEAEEEAPAEAEEWQLGLFFRYWRYIPDRYHPFYWYDAYYCTSSRQVLQYGEVISEN